MLVLTREKDQKLFIGDDITVEVVDIRGDKVRLGITAPKAVPIHREEVYRERAAEKAANRATDGED